MKAILRKFLSFLTTDIWRIRANKLPKTKSFWIKQLRIILLAMRGFDEDKCQLRASALTFYTLLSIVPMAAMAFGIAKGFGLEKILENQLLEKMAGQKEVAFQIINFANSFLENTRGGLVAGIGVVILFWTVVKVLGNIESSFNDIWGIKKGRSWGRKLSDYLSIMLVCPILLIISSSVTVALTSQAKLIIEKVAFLGALSPIIMLILKILPYGVIWVLFTFIYIFMPNAKVQFRSAFFGGVIGGTIYQVIQWVYITFQIGVSNFGAIYGSFAALPLFLVWLQTSWTVVLLGAEISFAEQNVETYEFEPDCLKVSLSFKRLLALRIAHVCIKNFNDGQPPRTANEISGDLDIPIRLVNQILFELTEAGIVTEAKHGDSKEFSYQPARNIEKLTVQAVIDALDQRGINDIPIAYTPEVEKIKEILATFDRLVAQSPANRPLKDF